MYFCQKAKAAQKWKYLEGGTDIFPEAFFYLTEAKSRCWETP